MSRSARPWSWLALAAVLALLAAIPWAWLRTSSPAGPEDPGRYAALLADPEAGLPAGWDDRPWTVARAPGDPLTPEARAARLGARLVGLELAMRARDTAAARLAGEIVVLLEGIPGAGPVAAVYRDLGQRAGEPSVELEPRLARGRTAVTRVADEEFVALGAWAEAARIAATRRDAGFFRARESRRTLERAGRLPGLGGQARAALDAVRTSLAADGPRDWSALERSLTALLRALGSPGASALR